VRVDGSKGNWRCELMVKFVDLGVQIIIVEETMKIVKSNLLTQHKHNMLPNHLIPPTTSIIKINEIMRPRRERGEKGSSDTLNLVLSLQPTPSTERRVITPKTDSSEHSTPTFSDAPS